MSESSLSGKAWWLANQAKYPNSRQVADLEPEFRDKVEAFIDTLRAAGAMVRISSTRRSAARAYLMHYSWAVAFAEVEPGDVPAHADVDILWDHGDTETSRQAAMEMVKLFGLAVRASLTSNHIKGLAIDMDIAWKGTLVLSHPPSLMARIETLPRSGMNRQLHEIGDRYFGVKKLKSDPPHWSYNGR
jgi:hypothetical protein